MPNPNARVRIAKAVNSSPDKTKKHFTIKIRDEQSRKFIKRSATRYTIITTTRQYCYGMIDFPSQRFPNRIKS